MAGKPQDPNQAPPDIGPKPQLVWIDKNLLMADHRYQRDAGGARSRDLIAKIAKNFSWLHCGTLVVVKSGEDYAVIDGQHRLAAAMRRRDIKDLPCCVLPTMSVADQAKAFVRLNRDRVSLNQLNIFWADVTSGDAASIGVRDSCLAAKVTLLKYPKPWSAIQAGETYVVGALMRIWRAEQDSRGNPTLRDTLGTIREAYPDRPGQLTAAMINAVYKLLLVGTRRDALVQVLRKTSASRLLIAARERVDLSNGQMRQADALHIELVGRLNANFATAAA